MLNLSPMNAVGPSCLFRKGNISDIDQSLKIGRSNQPDFVRFYLAVFVQYLNQVDYNISDLICSWRKLVPVRPQWFHTPWFKYKTSTSFESVKDIFLLFNWSLYFIPVHPLDFFVVFQWVLGRSTLQIIFWVCKVHANYFLFGLSTVVVDIFGRSLRQNCFVAFHKEYSTIFSRKISILKHWYHSSRSDPVLSVGYFFLFTFLNWHQFL